MAKRFHSLDGLRGICALSVVALHSEDLFKPGPLMPHGFLAVDMFFLISGFVIALNYEGRLGAGLALRGFLLERGRRLMPIFWIGAVLNIAVFWWMASCGDHPAGFTSADIWLWAPLSTVLMLPAFGLPGDGFSPVMNVSWSLMVEWLVNAIYARRPFRWRTRTLILIAATGWAIMAVAGYFTGRGWSAGFTRYEVFTYGLLRGVPAFFTGVVIYRLQARGALSRLPSISTELLLTVWLCVAVVPTPATGTPTFDAITVILLCPLLLALLVRSDDKAPAFCKPLGALSYPLYVAHPAVIMLARSTSLFGLEQGPNVPRAVILFAACVCAGLGVQALATLRPRRPRFGPRVSLVESRP